MNGLSEIHHILNDFSEENMTESFTKIVNSQSYKITPVGVCATIVAFFRQNETNGNLIMYNFLKFLFDAIQDPKLEVQINFLFLWIRASDETALDYQIQILEEHASQLRKCEIEYPGKNTFCHLAIAQLMQRCSTFILPDDNCNFNDTMKSKEFLERSNSYIRSNRSSEYRGKLHMITTRIFPAFADFTMAKNPVQAEVYQEPFDDDSIGRLIQKVATNSNVTLDNFNMIASYLEKVDCVPYNNRVQRMPARVLTSLQSFQDRQQDCEVCLQVALMCYMVDQDNDNRKQFVPLILKFSGICQVDGKMMINIINNAESTYLKYSTLQNKTADMTHLYDQVEPPKQRKFKPLLAPFELKSSTDEVEDGAVVHNNEDNRPIIEQIQEFAGKDSSKWFQSNGINEWRAARLCVFHAIDRLDPDAFALLPEQSEPEEFDETFLDYQEEDEQDEISESTQMDEQNKDEVQETHSEVEENQHEEDQNENEEDQTEIEEDQTEIEEDKNEIEEDRNENEEDRNENEEDRNENEEDRNEGDGEYDKLNEEEEEEKGEDVHEDENHSDSA